MVKALLIYLLIAALGIVVIHQAARTVVRPLRVNPRHEQLENL